MAGDLVGVKLFKLAASWPFLLEGLWVMAVRSTGSLLLLLLLQLLLVVELLGGSDGGKGGTGMREDTGPAFRWHFFSSTGGLQLGSAGKPATIKTFRSRISGS